MSLPKSIHAYADVIDVLSRLASIGGGQFRFTTEKEARNFLFRANMARSLLRKESDRTATEALDFDIAPERRAETFDRYAFSTEGTAFVMRPRLSRGALFDLQGNPVTPAEVAEIEELATKLNLDIE